MCYWLSGSVLPQRSEVRHVIFITVNHLKVRQTAFNQQ